MTKKTKRIIAVLVAVVLTAGGIVGGILIVGHNTPPVKVFSVADLAQMGYAEEGGADGQVYSRGIQKVYLSSSQILTDIHVASGQKVKAGDPLVSFDTTLSQVALERQRILAEKTALELERAKAHLQWIRSLVPFTPPAPQPEPEIELVPHELPCFEGGEGTPDEPYYFLWGEEEYLTDDFVNVLLPAEEDGEGGYIEETVYLVLEKRECDDPAGDLYAAWGMILRRESDGTASFAPFTAPQEPEPEPGPEPDEGGYTAREIAQMKADQEAVVKEAESRLKSEKLKYDRMKAEFDGGVVRAQEDGTVIAVNEEAFARETGEPLVTVSSGGGVFVKGNVSEWRLETLCAGQQVRVYGYESGLVETGEVVEIGQDPASSTSYDGNNPNASAYPVTVKMGENSLLRDGDYVSITFGEEEEGGLYLYRAFVLEENGESFVYARGENSKLEKRRLVTGRLLWGSLLEIREGLDGGDEIAFPYGKNVKSGAKCVSAGIDELYEME